MPRRNPSTAGKLPIEKIHEVFRYRTEATLEQIRMGTKVNTNAALDNLIRDALDKQLIAKLPGWPVRYTWIGHR